MQPFLLWTLLINVVLIVADDLGIGGTQQSICSSACHISAACRSRCLDETNTDKYIACLCQLSCVDFSGVCRSCCLASEGITSGKEKALADVNTFCEPNVASDLQTCNFYGNVAPNAQADVFQNDSFGYTATASFPPVVATFVSRLPSPSLVPLDVSTTPDASTSATVVATTTSASSAVMSSTPTTAPSSVTSTTMGTGAATQPASSPISTSSHSGSRSARPAKFVQAIATFVLSIADLIVML